jgi:hypothetical protein
VEVPSERFEDMYMNKLRALLGGHGLLLSHERDRGTLDLGLELVSPDRRLTGVRVWLQAKGRTATSLSLQAFEQADTVAVRLPLEYVRYWYGHGAAVYLVVYVESADLFLAEDIREIVDRSWQDFLGAEGPSLQDQKQITLKVRTSAVLDAPRVQAMERHRTMRVDGPQFRGRYLGHRFDPLRSILNVVEPTVFLELSAALLAAHRYREDASFAADAILDLDRGSLARASFGYLRETYEWSFFGSVELGYSRRPDERGEGGVVRAQGPVAVLVVPSVTGRLRLAAGAHDALKALAAQGAEKLLVVANAPELEIFHPFNTIGRLFLPPQGIEGVGYSLLVTTTVYEQFRSRVSWKSAATIEDWSDAATIEGD